MKFLGCKAEFSSAIVPYPHLFQLGMLCRPCFQGLFVINVFVALAAFQVAGALYVGQGEVGKVLISLG